MSRSYSRAELQREFSFSEEEVTWVKSRSNAAFRLNLAVLFKTFQVLRYFPEIAEVPEPVVDFIRTQIGLRSKVALSPYKWMQLYRHMSAVREKLGVRPFYGSDGQDIASTHAQLMAPLLEQRADIINAIIDELLRQNYELPAYSTLNDLAEAARAEAQEKIFNLVVARAPIKVIYKLRDLLDTDFGRRQSDFNTLKQAPKKPSRKHLEVLIDHLAWLESFGKLDAIFDGIVDTKIRHFAAQAAASDVSELKDCSLPKRYTLMLALIYRMRVRTRDHLAEMFIRRISTIHKRAKEELEQIQARQRQKLEQLAATNGPSLGYLVTHHEAISIADFLTLRTADETYRPTVHYAYRPSDEAILSVHEWFGNDCMTPEKTKVLRPGDILSGSDYLGVLLMGHEKSSYWYGSILSIEKAKELATLNTATTLQVAAGVLSGYLWILSHPSAGIIEAEDMDHEVALSYISQYLGELKGVYSDWNPTKNNPGTFSAIDSDSPWLFSNFVL